MKLMRQALEGDTVDNDQEQSVLIKGPLSEVYTQSLNIAYAKEPIANETSAEPGTAMESQAQDAMLLQKLMTSITPDPSTDENYVTLYAVDKDNVTDDDIIKMTQTLADSKTNDSNVDDFVLIMDATQPGPNSQVSGEPTERYVNLAAAMESIATAHGVRVFSSLLDYAKRR